MAADKHSPRAQSVINGVEHIRCSSCQQMLPNDRANFYLLRDKKGNPRPHSWCKPCYLSNTGRGDGGRAAPAPLTPPEIVFIQKCFLNLAPPRDVDRFTGCALLAA